MTPALTAAILAEVAEVLGAHGQMVCVPEVEYEEDGTLRLTVAIQTGAYPPAYGVSLYDDLRYVCDVAQMRALCARHGFDPAWLEKALNDKEQR